MLLFDQGLTLNSIIDIQKVGSLIALQSFVTAPFSLSHIYMYTRGNTANFFGRRYKMRYNHDFDQVPINNSWGSEYSILAYI